MSNEPKKRGRKPKGGKIIQPADSAQASTPPLPTIILHLKCSLKDLQQTQPDAIESYNANTSTYSVVNNTSAVIPICTPCEPTSTNEDAKQDMKETWKKLKQLEQDLHVNNVYNKRSACFWDTCEFDNPPIYIPKHVVNGSYQVYGCFCSPECGVAYLMSENLDSSTKFERYHLFNHIYAGIYKYNKNIKPAPDPRYMLDKFYGNLSIQEYRSLLHTDRLFSIVDKPLTKMLPELHEDNDDFILNNTVIPSSNGRRTMLSARLGANIKQNDNNNVHNMFQAKKHT